MRTRRSPKELIRDIVRQDEDAMDELYDRYVAALFAVALRLLGNHEEAEEILQETFLEAWKRAPEYDHEKSSVSIWLMVICRSRAIDRLRMTASSQRVLGRFRGEPLPDQAGECRGRVVTRDRRRYLHRALAGLPREQREAIVLAYSRDLTQPEIAKKLDIPLGTVKTRTYLALVKLRHVLEPVRRELL